MKKYGFNLLWMYAFNEQPYKCVNEKELNFIADNSFNFIRMPLDYNFWTKDFDYFNPDEKVLEQIDKYYIECEKRGLHFCLNLHRAPGYCTNRNELEKHNLWTDKEALDGFVFLWELFAKRYKGISSSKISFDLLNEPPCEGLYGLTRDIHQHVMRTTISAIRAIDPDRDIVLDGLCGGSFAIPELADTGTIHSGRGYMPFEISHYKASWCGEPNWSEPVYPGVNGPYLWDREALYNHYSPWFEVNKTGTEIHIGECGCYNKTPNDVALRWLGDLFSVYKEYGWGFALWNFDGPFGIINHGRPSTKYTQIGDYQVDMELLNIIKNNMI